MVIYFYIEHLSNSVVHNGRLFWDTLQQFNLSQINCAGFRCGSSLDSENEPRMLSKFTRDDLFREICV